MPSPSSQRIRTDIDAEGRLALSWEVMGKVESRLMASLLAGVALIWVSIGHSMPMEFWGLLQARGPGDPDWLGLAITGGGSVFFCLLPMVLILAAWRIAFLPKPERLVLGHDKLVYEPGSAALAPAAGGGAPPLWRALFGSPKYEVAKEEFGGAFLGSYKRLEFVGLQMGRRQVRIGRWLRLAEQEQLVRTVTDWQQR